MNSLNQAYNDGQISEAAFIHIYKAYNRVSRKSDQDSFLSYDLACHVSFNKDESILRTSISNSSNWDFEFLQWLSESNLQYLQGHFKTVSIK